MNTSAVNDKAKKTFSPKHILLTLKKNPGHSHMSAVISPIDKNRDAKVSGRKLLKMKKNICEPVSEGVRSIVLKDVGNLDESNIADLSLPKITQISRSNKRLPSIERSFALDKGLFTESQFLHKCTNMLHEQQRLDIFFNKSVKMNTNDSKCRTLQLTLNKHSRFIPNILKSTKIIDGTFSSITDPTESDNASVMKCNEASEHSEDQVMKKRKRKQVLRPLNLKRHQSKINQTFAKKKKINLSLPKFRDNRNLTEDSNSTASDVNPKNISEQDVESEFSKPKKGYLAITEELMPDSIYCDELHTANLEVLCKTGNLSNDSDGASTRIDQSVEKIFEEFKEPDYKNYIASEDLHFDIDEMDKLLSSDVNSLLLESSAIVQPSTNIIEYDVNGNDIVRHCREFENRYNKSTQEQDSSRKITHCYNNELEMPINTFTKIIHSDNLDDSYSNTFDCDWDFEFDDDFQEFQQGLEKPTFSTYIDSEPEIGDVNYTKTSNAALPITDELNSSAISLVVSNKVPDNVFSDEFNEQSLDSLQSNDDRMKQLLDSNSNAEKCHLNANYSSDNNNCVSLDFDTNCELFKSGNCSADKKLNTDLLEEQTHKDFNALFDFKGQFLSDEECDMNGLEIENGNIEDSQPMQLGDAFLNSLQSVSDVPLQSCTFSDLHNDLSLDLEREFHANSILISNYHNSWINDTEFEKPVQIKATNTKTAGYNVKSTCVNAIENEDSMLQNVVQSEMLTSCLDTGHLNYTDSLLLNILSRRRSDHPSTCDAKVIDTDTMQSCSRCSPLWMIRKRNLKKLSTSNLESLAHGPHNCMDLLPLISHRSISEMSYKNAQPFKSGKNSDDIHRLPLKNHSDISRFHSTKRFYSKISGYQTGKNASHFNFTKELNVTYRHFIPSSNESLNHQDLLEGQSISCKVSSLEKLRSTHELVTNLEKPSQVGKIRYRYSYSRSWFLQYLRAVRNNSKRKSNKQIHDTARMPCPYCDKTYKSDVTLDNHVKDIHRYRPSQFIYKNKKYVCDKCSKEYVMSAAIAKHFKLHEDYSLTCRQCKEHFSEKKFLMRHINDYHLIQEFHCSSCNRKFTRKKEYTRHLNECEGCEDSSS
ncbi:uncharacterized protein LOC124299841 isoform X1 [Neodiprion virginianus]|uniref:uncharacterized protein LOC124299841 isoform X1 n=1 Tax=Neodiprion virginianus TaxID=2961670 RepID=UPI001EE71355|nr:uncharacterized protein LOC124299841 isoform X1 [Neodiprion virginianus]